jgi:hypothetical protein
MKKPTNLFYQEVESGEVWCNVLGLDYIKIQAEAECGYVTVYGCIETLNVCLMK